MRGKRTLAVMVMASLLFLSWPVGATGRLGPPASGQAWYPADIAGSTVSPDPTSYVAGGSNAYDLAVHNGSIDGEFLDRVRVTFPNGWTISSLTWEEEACYWPVSMAASGVGARELELEVTGQPGGVPFDCTWQVQVTVAVPGGATGVQGVSWKLWGDEMGADPPHELTGSFTLSDLVAQPAIGVSPASLAATLCPGDTAEQALTIRNDGEAELTWSLAENPAVDWLSELPAGDTLDPSASTEVTVTFDATSQDPGAYNTTLRISSNDPGTPLVEVPVTLTVADTPAPFGGWLVLDGADDWASAEDQSELDVGDEAGESLTVETWVNLENFRNGPLVRKGDAFNLYTLWQQGMRCLGFSLRSGGSEYQQQSCTTVGEFWIPGWHHVAGVFDRAAGQMSLYMDGERLANPFAIGQVLINNSDEPLQVSFSRSTHATAAGAELFDEIRLSDIVRYSGASYAVPSSAFGCDGHTRALWHFDEAAGSTLFHDGCGAVDNQLVGHNGAHSEGGAAQPAIAISPSSLAATLRPDQVSVQTLTIRNEGSAELTWSLAENPAVAWLFEQPASGSLSPGADAAVTVTFDPTGQGQGSYGTTLRVSSNDPAMPVVKVPATLHVEVGAYSVYLPLAIRSAELQRLYHDGFGDPGSGWESHHDEAVDIGYLGGEYQIRLKEDNYCAGMTADLSLPATYRAEIEARQVGANAGAYALTCGVRASGNSWEGLQFLVHPQSQQYLLNRRDLNGAWTTLIDWTPWAGINAGTATNRLRCDRLSDRFVFYLNGLEVASTTGAGLGSAGRDAGPRACSYDDAPVDMRFDNMAVYRWP